MNLSQLEKYLPENALSFVEVWLQETDTIIKLKNSRKTKLGDYLYVRNSDSHQITIDKKLNPEIFFFVLTHEIAHLLVRKKLKTRIKPHGQEWKTTFGTMLKESLNVYSAASKNIILHHSKSPKANLVADAQLWNHWFSDQKNEDFKIEKLDENQKFRIGRRIFQKKGKRKIRYICKEINTGKLYLINGQAIADEIISE